ncbi:hypothetical protein LPN04_27435 [Rugamonas sp. A1-17]|nr:hypothetical protein [Rugamonas sp. A1-17]
MSRLLPETVTIGLLPGQCWLRRGARDTEYAGSAGPQALLHSLEFMLDKQTRPLDKRARVQVQVSDSLAAITVLPWQEQLSAADELRAYAHACFEQQGVRLDEGWAMQTGYRRFRAGGLAYALPQAWLAQLMSVLEARGLRLQSVLPVSAAAYWRGQGGRLPGQELWLLQEAQRLTALVYEGGSLLAIDVQPVTEDGIAAAGGRLLRRVVARHRAIARLRHWPVAQLHADAPEFVADCLPEAVVSPLLRHAWS